MVRKPAGKKSSNECSHDFERFGDFGHSVSFNFEDDDRVADDDDEEWDDKPSQEARHSNYLVNVRV